MIYAYTRPRYQVSVYMKIGPLVDNSQKNTSNKRPLEYWNLEKKQAYHNYAVIFQICCLIAIL